MAPCSTPTLGAWAQHFLGASHKTLPSSVTVNRSSNHGNGWFPAAYSPLPILNPADGLMDTKSPVTEAVVAKRTGLLAELDAGFGGKASDESVKSYNEFYESTFQLMKSTDLKAFDLASEPAEMKARYGKSKFGQGCLLARRLIENGVRFVEVASGGWDMHATLDDRMTDVGGDFDRVYATLIQDLESRDSLPPPWSSSLPSLVVSLVSKAAVAVTIRSSSPPSLRAAASARLRLRRQRREGVCPGS